MLMTAATLALCMAIGAAISHYVMDRSMREFEGRDAATAARLVPCAG